LKKAIGTPLKMYWMPSLVAVTGLAPPGAHHPPRAIDLPDAETDVVIHEGAPMPMKLFLDLRDRELDQHRGMPVARRTA
jgi:hypothetical protein